jgi:hypothetical protein
LSGLFQACDEGGLSCEGSANFVTAKFFRSSGAAKGALYKASQVFFVQGKSHVALLASRHTGKMLGVRLVEKDARWDMVAGGGI